MNTGPVEILFVEDDPADVRLTLESFGDNHLANRVHVARDGAEALEYIFCTGRYADRQIADVPKLILLDLKLPLVNGLDVLEAIKRDARTRAIPVVVLTSSRENPDIQRAYQLGVNSYIVKPVNFEQFRKAVLTVGLYWAVMNEPPGLTTGPEDPHAVLAVGGSSNRGPLDITRIMGGRSKGAPAAPCVAHRP
ncbi:MAG TPA: response regulator [Acidimicrobiia bacterium]|nr:response regulator [Acidimicrobiia bacterium]